MFDRLCAVQARLGPTTWRVGWINRDGAGRGGCPAHWKRRRAHNARRQLAVAVATACCHTLVGGLSAAAMGSHGQLAPKQLQKHRMCVC
jgi:hypothetical protein